MENIFIYYLISIFVEAHSRSTCSVQPYIVHTLVFFFKQKIIDRDIHKLLIYAAY